MPVIQGNACYPECDECFEAIGCVEMVSYVDNVPSRPTLTASIGTVLIGFSRSSSVDQMLAYGPHGVLCSVDSVWLEIVGAQGEHQENMMVNQMVRATQTFGVVAMSGSDLFERTAEHALGSTSSPKQRSRICVSWMRFEKKEVACPRQANDKLRAECAAQDVARAVKCRGPASSFSTLCYQSTTFA